MEIVDLIEQLGEDASSSSLVDARELAEKLLRRYGQRNLFALAVSDLANRIDLRRRSEARRIEMESQRARKQIPTIAPDGFPILVPVDEMTADEVQQAEARWNEWMTQVDQRNVEEAKRREQERKDSQPTRFAAIRDEPLRWSGLYRHIRARSYKRPDGGPVELFAAEVIQFKEFLGDGYDEWMKFCSRRKATIQPNDWSDSAFKYPGKYEIRAHKFFFVHPEIDNYSGPEAWTDWENEKDTRSFVKEIQDRMRLELTEELLGSAFATGDGGRVTWGEATVGQHQARFEMLRKHTRGTAETAARHGLAIKLLQEAGVDTLAEMRELIE